jgi:hypothetical protein
MAQGQRGARQPMPKEAKQQQAEPGMTEPGMTEQGMAAQWVAEGLAFALCGPARLRGGGDGSGASRTIRRARPERPARAVGDARFVA